ncbi:MAG TPA: amidohydrolase family protein [bacterium]|nr:amidohydrolase family protein [bacterium]
MKNKSFSSTDMKFPWKKRIDSMEIFDAGCWLGKTPLFPLMPEGTMKLLDSSIKKHSIKEALVSHWLGGKYSVMESNRLLLETVRNHPGRYAIITGLPLLPREKGFSDVIGAMLSDTKVKGVRIYPGTFRYSALDWCVGSLCEMMAEKNIPLFIFHTETSFRDLHSLAGSFPRLRICIETQIRKIIYHSRELLPLMRRCQNIYIDISNLCAPGMLEYFMNTTDTGRLFFSSFMPANDPMVPIGLLLSEAVPEKDRKAIAGGNMRRIVAEIKQ